MSGLPATSLFNYQARAEKEQRRDQHEQRLYRIETLLKLILARLGGREEELPWVVAQKEQDAQATARKEKAWEEIGEEIKSVCLKRNRAPVSFYDIFRALDASRQAFTYEAAGIPLDSDGEELKGIIEHLIAADKLAGTVEMHASHICPPHDFYFTLAQGEKEGHS